jgi:uncharacterized repeat protein (TIGR03803 family)
MNTWKQFASVSFFSLVLMTGSVAFAGTVTTIHDFGTGPDGENPQAGVIFDQTGNLYGTAALGALRGNGLVYSLTPEGGDIWTESFVHRFTGPPDGSVPVSSLIISSNGTLFGTTLEGGDQDMGTVFEATPPQNQGDPWKRRILYSFGAFAGDGIHPNAGLLPARPGFYGVTRDGGATGRGCVFQLTPPIGGGSDWTETILYNFTDSGDAAFPSSELTRDQEGNLYGTGLLGGTDNLGAVYQLSPPTSEGGTWTETVIFSFGGTDGSSPFGRLVFDDAGALYGTTTGGGTGQAGTVYKLTPASQPGASWSQSVLYNFSGGKDGGSPFAGVIFGSKGRLFGTASTGGNGRPLPGGVVFRLDPPANDGDPWTEKVLHPFGGPDGFRPLCQLVWRDNALYGTTSAGGLNGTGNVFVAMP